MHKYLDPEVDREFWNFSFEEMGMVDSKAVISYIKNNTGNEKITFIGQSQGSALMFYALSKDSEWFKDNLNLFAALAPVTRVTRESFPFYQLFVRNKPFLRLLDMQNMVDTYK